MDNNPIDLSQLFNFSDTTPLSNVIDMITQLNTLYGSLVQSAQTGAANVTASMQAMQKSIDALEQTMNDADVQTKAGQDTINKGAAATANAVASNDNYKKSLADLTAQIALLQAQQDKLTDSKTAATTANVNEAGSLNDLKKQLADATAAYSKMGTAVDQSVKQASLKNISDLNAQVKAGTQAINDAKKATDNASGSYNALVAQVNAATKQLKAFEGGIGSNSDAFKKLQQDVLNGNSKLKDFDSAIGNSQRNVGDYKNKIVEALGSLSPQAAAATSAFEGMGSKLMTAFLNPIAAGIAVVVAGFLSAKAAVNAYYDDTIEGADKSKTAFIEYEATVQVLKGTFKELGKNINDALGIDKEDSLINNFIKINLLMLGAKDTIASIALKEQQLVAISQLENDLKKEEIALVVTLAENEDARQKALYEARDKINNTDEVRYANLQKARQLQIENIALETDSNNKQIAIQTALLAKKGIQVTAETSIKDLLEDQSAIVKLNYGDVQKLADLRAKSFQIDQQGFQGMRRIQAQESELIKDFETKQIASAQAVEDAKIIFAETFYQREIDINSKIVGNQRYSLDEQLDAQQKLGEAQGNLAQVATDKAIQAAHTEAMTKVKLSQDTLDQIAAINDPAKKAAAIIAAENAELELDKNFQSVKKALTSKGYEQEQNDLIASNLKKIQIIQQYYASQITQAQNQVSIIKDSQLSGVAQGVTNGSVGPGSYDKQNAAINFAAQVDQAQRTLDIYNNLYSELAESGKASDEDITAAHAKATAAQLAIDKLHADQSVANQKRVNAALLQLTNQVFDAAKQIYDQQAQAKIDAISAQSDAIQKAAAAEVQLIQDTAKQDVASQAAAKEQIASINNKASEQEADLAKKTLVIKQKEAQFNKDIDTSKAITNTAVAVTQALASAPPPYDVILAAIAGAAGAVQVALIQSTPIPQYWTGTDFSKEGLSLVGERGREIGISPTGETKMYDKPQLTYLKEGTTILNNSKTESILRKMTVNQMNAQASDLIDNGQRDLKVVVAKDPELLKAIKANKPVDTIRQGLDLIDVVEARNGSKRFIRNKIFKGR